MSEIGCDECVVDETDDPAPWCDCLPSHGDEPCRGKCKQRAHAPENCPRPYLRCDRCNYDRHECPGCGEPLKHGVEVCAACRAVAV